jgi:ABC transport system ATP-binding/permease protein
MASRWAYEAMAVYQFKHNSYEEPYYKFDKYEAQFDFKASYLVDELDKKRRFIAEHLTDKSDSIQQIVLKDIHVIQTTLQKDSYKKGFEKELASPWTKATFTPGFSEKLEKFLANYKTIHQEYFNKAIAARDNVVFQMENAAGTGYHLNAYKNKYYNESLADLVKNITEKERIIEYKGELIQQINPIFQDVSTENPLNYRAPFFAPTKNLLGAAVSTYWFDILMIWLMSVVLYITLYFELLRKLVNSFDKVPGKMSLSKVNAPKKK